MSTKIWYKKFFPLFLFIYFDHYLSAVFFLFHIIQVVLSKMQMHTNNSECVRKHCASSYFRILLLYLSSFLLAYLVGKIVYILHVFLSFCAIIFNVVCLKYYCFMPFLIQSKSQCKYFLSYFVFLVAFERQTSQKLYLFIKTIRFLFNLNEKKLRERLKNVKIE